MKTAIFFAFMLLAWGCERQGNNTTQNGSLISLPVNTGSLKGVYTGDFNGSPLSVVLHFFSGRHVSGYNIHKGLKRNIAGTMFISGKELTLNLSEPGTNPYDGKFKIIIDTFTKKATAWWTRFSDKNDVKHFILNKAGPPSTGNYGWMLVDSLQNSFEFQNDGSCSYNYLSGDSSSTAQQLTIKGNYKIEQDSLLSIFWQPNSIFPTKSSTFTLHFTRIEPDEPYRLKSISFNGRTFSELYD